MSNMDALPVPKSRYSALTRQTGSTRSLQFDDGLPAEGQYEPQQWREEKRMSGGRSAVIVAMLCVVLPMLGLAGLLIGLVIGHRIDTNPSVSQGGLDFTPRSAIDDSAYYVDFNATTLATIASWSKAEEHSFGDSHDLPTPFQFGLLLETLTGGITAFLSLGAYWSWRHKERMASMLRSSFIVLFVASVVGYAIAGVDTWLHLVMDTVQLDIPTTVATPQQTYGRVFHNDASHACTNATAGNFDVSACSVALAVTGTFLSGSNEAWRVLSNISMNNMVRTLEVDGKTLAYTGPAQVPPEMDYKASTLALHTSCEPITSKCDLNDRGAAAAFPFHCTDAFFGDLLIPTINGEETDSYSGLTLPQTWLDFYTNPSLTTNANATIRDTPRNPYYLGVWSFTSTALTSAQEADGEFRNSGHGGQGWLLNCTSTAYDLTYSWINGSASASPTDAKIANGTIGTILQSTLYYGFGKNYFANAAYAASTYDSSAQLAAQFSQQYSELAMGLSSGNMDSVLNLYEQTRRTILVTRIPKIPLYFLIAFNTLYAIFAIILFCIAMSAQPTETNDVRERLSYAGLVAFCFEGARAKRPVEKKRQLFAEYEGDGRVRIGVERSEKGGWEYTRREEFRNKAEGEEGLVR